MIRLNLPLPVSKNARHMAVKCGRFYKTVRTKAARLKEEAAVALIWQQLGGRLRQPSFTRPVSVTVFLVFPDKRQRDGANYTESLFDCLERSGVVSNDALIVHHVCEVSPEFHKPGSCTVTIDEIP